jgi:AcrR family transcriptional regulator
MDKKELILDAMQKLMTTEKGMDSSVSDIAKCAGIGKGSIYYYFKSKEEILEALIDRTYHKIIENCRVLIESSHLDAISNLKLLIQSYYNSLENSYLDKYLHLPQNAFMHQKSLAKILLELTPIVDSILRQGIKEGSLECNFPTEYSQIILSVFTFLMDPGIFNWSNKQRINKMKALANIMELGLNLEPNSMNFLFAN